jgi:putative ABC transport system substrate-binding protein
MTNSGQSWAALPGHTRTGAPEIRSGPMQVACIAVLPSSLDGINPAWHPAPAAGRFAVMVNPANPLSDPFFDDVRSGATRIGGQIELFTARNSRDIDEAFANLVQKRLDALLVGPDVLFRDRRIQLATLTARHALPAIYAVRENADAGGLMSYGSSFQELFRQAGIYTGRILKGEQPATLPVARATKFELVINLQTARVLGIEVPASLLAIADEVIE